MITCHIRAQVEHCGLGSSLWPFLDLDTELAVLQLWLSGLTDDSDVYGILSMVIGHHCLKWEKQISKAALSGI